MTLNINSSARAFHPNAAAGANGANGSLANRDGTAGAAGAVGLAALIEIVNRSFLGDAGGDVVNITRQSRGGAGGAGGRGGAGAEAPFTQSINIVEGLPSLVKVYGTAGAGGAGGQGGSGGAATTNFTDLIFDLGGGAVTPNEVVLHGTALGGKGGAGGSAGNGGISAPTSITRYTNDNGSLVIGIEPVQGSPGGSTPNSTGGTTGQQAQTTLSRLTLSGESLQITLAGEATGGAGGSGGAGARSGGGSASLPAGHGGDGGAGARAVARMLTLDVQGTDGLNLTIVLAATGGAGGVGGRGGNATAGRDFQEIETSTGFSIYSELRTFAAAGNGGNGGSGGNALATLDGATIIGSAAVDEVNLAISVEGGQGGAGGTGGIGAVSETVGRDEYIVQIVGTPDGAQGHAGRSGTARIVVRDVKIDLGDGADFLSLALQASGRKGTIDLVTTSFAGGLGRDTLQLGKNNPGAADSFVDVQARTLSFGSGTGAAISGFEVFIGGGGKDHFTDGRGSQTYSGGNGTDSFVFTQGRAGQDWINDFAADEVIRLIGFGPALDSFAEVLAVTTDAGFGALIQTSATSSILIAGVDKADLVADDFIF